MKKVVELNNVSKSYANNLKVFYSTLFGRSSSISKNNEILENTNLSFFKSEIIGIIGRNGAGKTTLLKLISGTSDRTVPATVRDPWRS